MNIETKLCFQFLSFVCTTKANEQNVHFGLLQAIEYGLSIRPRTERQKLCVRPYLLAIGFG